MWYAINYITFEVARRRLWLIQDRMDKGIKET